MKWHLALAVVFAIASPNVLAQGKKVGSTEDACDKDEVVKFQDDTSTRKVFAKGSGKGFDVTAKLPALTDEIQWYCGDSRERSANDKPFNKVHLVRATNGAMKWEFFVENAPPPSTPGPGGSSGSAAKMSRMGETYDDCNAPQAVTFTGLEGTVTVKPGELVLKQLPNLIRRIRWKCADSVEHSVNPNAFNFAQLERAGNGAMHWVFYRSADIANNPGLLGNRDSSPVKQLGDYLHNVPGDFAMATASVVQPAQTPLKAGAFKALLDGLLPTFSGLVAGAVTGQLANEDDVTIGTPVLPTTNDKTELRVADPGPTLPDGTQTIAVKYVIHGIQVPGKFKGAISFNALIDGELVMLFPKNSAPPLHVAGSVASIGWIVLKGSDPKDDVVLAFLKSSVHAKETNLQTKFQDITNLVNAALDAVSKSVMPAGTKTVVMTTDGNGGLRVCFKKAALGACKFGPSHTLSKARQVLDTSHDGCGESKMWLWDSEKGRFVSLAKGVPAILVEVDNQRFEWFCGNNTEPLTTHDEWTTGPTETRTVRVSRKPTGGQIDWQFLFWR